jgi:AcrR family transcriptional regulator
MPRKKGEDRIIEAAIKVFAKKGYSGATVKDIIKEAKISRGTFYLYYHDKKELFNALLENFMKEVIQAFADIHYDTLKTYKDFCEHIKKVSNVFKDIVLKNKELTKIIYMEGVISGKAFSDKVDFYINHLLDISERFLNFCMDKKIIRKVQPRVVSHIAAGIVKELLFQFVEEKLPVAPDEIIEEGIEFYTRALKRE